MKTTVGKLNVKFDEYMKDAKGFTIGKGKLMFWYIVPQTNAFNAYPLDINNHYKRRIKPTTEVTIHHQFHHPLP